ncbi:MAG: hypothetical protein HDT32_05975 [Clostridiales bacterium]|nr:hypothetical protein [Clostridiales bacterium]
MTNLRFIKSKLIIIALLITMISSIILVSSFSLVSADTYAGGVEVEKHEEVSDYFGEEQTVEFEREIYDFDQNKFVLYELTPSGYAIFSIKDEAKIFLEGSDEVYSPYHNYLDKDLRYLGFGNYIFGENGIYTDIVTMKQCGEYELNGSYVLEDEAYIEKPSAMTRSVSFPSEPDPNNTITDRIGYTYIKNYKYFTELVSWPSNTKGSCAIVALCIMLGYLDEYVDSRFITDYGQYKGNPFKFANFATQALHDYLLDNCLHTVLGLTSSGYPMTNTEIKKMMQDYLDNQVGKDFRKEVNFVGGSVTYTHANPRKHINAGYPTMLTMTKYESDYGGKGYIDGKYHTVVAYGYKESTDSFKVHIGWDSGSQSVIVTSATIYSYTTFTI